MLFKNYPKLTYRIAERDVLLSDIFKNVSFADVDSSAAFSDYYIQDGDSPESISTTLYGSPIYSWLVLLPNKILSLKTDWFLSLQEHNRLLDINYGGDAYYISALPDIKPGDILVKVTGTGGVTATAIDVDTYRFIADFDPYFRKIRGICGSGTINSGDSVLFARQNKINGTVEPLSFNSKDYTPVSVNHTDVLYTEKYLDSILYFIDMSNVILDPYRYGITGASAAKTTTTYSNPAGTTVNDNFAKTVLYRYGVCGGTPPFAINKKTISENQELEYISKQKIRVLKPEFAPLVVSTLTNELQSSAVFKTITITI
jgi:Base plate wedge protein 53